MRHHPRNADKNAERRGTHCTQDSEKANQFPHTLFQTLPHTGDIWVIERPPPCHPFVTEYHVRCRACCTISTRTFLVSPGLLTSRKNAMRAPFIPSLVFRRT